MQKHFNELFTISNGAITPKATIHINGVTVGPGVSFGGGTGVNLTKLVDKTFEVELKNGVYIVRGIHKD